MATSRLDQQRKLPSRIVDIGDIDVAHQLWLLAVEGLDPEACWRWVGDLIAKEVANDGVGIDGAEDRRIGQSQPSLGRMLRPWRSQPGGSSDGEDHDQVEAIANDLDLVFDRSGSFDPGWPPEERYVELGVRRGRLEVTGEELTTTCPTSAREGERNLRPGLPTCEDLESVTQPNCCGPPRARQIND